MNGGVGVGNGDGLGHWWVLGGMGHCDLRPTLGLYLTRAMTGPAGNLE